MTYNERNKQALLFLNETKNEIRREIYIQTFLNTDKSYADCYDIANKAALAYIRNICGNNKTYDVIELMLNVTETNTVQYAYLAAGG